MEFEHTYPPYTSHTLLHLFIYLKKERPTPLRAMVVVEGGKRKLTNTARGLACLNTGLKEGRRARVFTYRKAFVPQVLLQCNRGCDARGPSKTQNDKSITMTDRVTGIDR
jgi:hypothetical protein